MTTSHQPIVAITRKEVKEIYWDLQVDGTHNYVTVDGAVHHNSTKTTAGILKIAYHASRMAACNDGIRRSKAIWIRNTREQLQDTSIPDFLQWYPDGAAGVFMKTGLKFLLKFGDVECLVLFRGLDDANDVRRLLSLQASFAVLDEFREIHPDIFESIQGRLGRYPNGAMVPHRPEWGVDARGNPIQGCVTDTGESNAHLWGMTNPPDFDTFWEDLLTSPPSNTHVTIQPGGLSPGADWLQYLPSGYYENLALGHTQDWIDVYINAEFGKSLSGRPVFRCFDRATHVSPTPLRHNPHATNPVVIGFDCTGLNPAAVVGQTGPGGRLYVLASMSAEEMGPLRFIREVLKPMVIERYAGTRVLVVIDPAGMNRGNDEKNVADILKAEGFVVIPARTNGIAARLSAVEHFLTRTIDGGPGMMIDPSCTNIIAGLAGKYRYKINTKGAVDDKPAKEHPIGDECFVAGTMIATPDGPRPIETLQAGDMVTTPGGAQRVLAAACVHDDAEVWEYTMSNGAVLVATPDHKVYSHTSQSFVPIDSIQYSDILEDIESRGAGAWKQQLSVFARAAEESSARPRTGSNRAEASIAAATAAHWHSVVQTAAKLMGFGSVAAAETRTIGIKTGTAPACPCISTCGRSTTGQSPTALRCTTLTGTQRITVSTTSLFSPAWSMGVSIYDAVLRLVHSICRRTCTLLSSRLEHGIALPKVSRGIVSTESGHGKVESVSQMRAYSVGSSTTCCVEPRNEGSAPPAAKGWLARLVAWTMRVGRAVLAELCSVRTSMARPRPAVRIVGKRRLPQHAAVYTLQVANEPMYYAEGVLVRNCDSLQYVCLHADGGTIFGAQVGGRKREVMPAPAGGWS